MYMNLNMYVSHFEQNYTLQLRPCRKVSEMPKFLHCDTVNCVIYIYSVMYYYNISFCRIKPLLSANITYIIIAKQ